MIEGKVDVDLSGFRYLRGSQMNRAMRISINRAAGPVKSALQAAAPAKTGDLRKSIKIKNKYYPASGVWAAIIGPSRAKRKPPKPPKPKKARRKKRKAKANLQSIFDGIVKGSTRRKKGNRLTDFAAFVKRAKYHAKRGGITAIGKAFKKRKPKPPKAPKPPKIGKKKAKRKGKAKRGFSPTRYAWQVEFGTRKSHARPWLRPTLASTQSGYAAALSDSLRREIATMLP